MAAVAVVGAMAAQNVNFQVPRMPEGAGAIGAPPDGRLGQGIAEPAAPMDRQQVQDMIAAAEGRTDRQFGELRGDIGTLKSNVERLLTRVDESYHPQTGAFVRLARVETAISQLPSKGYINTAVAAGVALILGLLAVQTAVQHFLVPAAPPAPTSSKAP